MQIYSRRLLSKRSIIRSIAVPRKVGAASGPKGFSVLEETYEDDDAFDDLPPHLRANALATTTASESSSSSSSSSSYSEYDDLPPHLRHSVGKRLPEILPDLCYDEKGEEIIANIMYQALEAMENSEPNERLEKLLEFQSDLYSALTSLFETHHVHHGAEHVFALLNPSTLKKVAPTLRPVRKGMLREAVVQPLARFCLLNKGALKRIDVQKLFEITGPKGFATLLYRLDLDVHRIKGPHLASLFDHLYRDTPAAAMRLAFQFRLPARLDEDFCNFRDGEDQVALGMHSKWSLQELLSRLCQSKTLTDHFLRLFFFELVQNNADHLIREAILFLRRKDPLTGIMSNPWAFSQALKLERESRKGIFTTTKMISPPAGVTAIASEAPDLFESYARQVGLEPGSSDVNQLTAFEARQAGMSVGAYEGLTQDDIASKQTSYKVQQDQTRIRASDFLNMERKKTLPIPQASLVQTPNSLSTDQTWRETEPDSSEDGRVPEPLISGGPEKLHDMFVELRDVYRRSDSGWVSVETRANMDSIPRKVFDSMQNVDFTGARQNDEYLPAVLLPVEQIELIDTSPQKRNSKIFKKMSYISEKHSDLESLRCFATFFKIIFFCLMDSTHQLASMYKLLQTLSDSLPIAKTCLPVGDCDVEYKNDVKIEDHPLHMIGIDLEWGDGAPVSLIQIALSDGRAFVIDVADRTVLYMSMVFQIMSFIMQREESIKLLFGLQEDISRLNALFDSFGRLTFCNVVDVRARRIQRRKVHLSSLEQQEKSVGSPLVTIEKQREAESLEDLKSAFDDFVDAGPPSSGEVNSQIEGESRVVEEILMYGGGQSLEAVALEALQIRIDKRLQRSNWSPRKNFQNIPLSQAQVHYAAFDAMVLVLIETSLRKRGILPPEIFSAAGFN